MTILLILLFGLICLIADFALGVCVGRFIYVGQREAPTRARVYDGDDFGDAPYGDDPKEAA